MIKFIFTYAGLLLLITSCATTKDNLNKQINAPTTFLIDDNYISQNDAINNLERRVFIKDTLLNSMIDSVLKNNHNILFAIKTIEKHEELLKQSNANNIPEINLQLNAKRNYFSENSLNGKNGFDLKNALGKNYVDDYIAGINLNWEPDIWLKNKNKKKVAIAMWLKENEILKKIKFELIESTASSYYDLVAIKQKLEIATKNLQLSNDFLKNVKLKKKYGVGNELDVQQSEIQLIEVKNLIVTLENQLRIKKNAIKVLLNDIKWDIEITSNIEDFIFDERININSPNQLLANNPDIKSDVYEFDKKVLLSKIAYSEQYPSLNFNLNAGLNSFNNTNWLALPTSLFASTMVSLTQPIWNKRKLKTDYNISKIELDQAVININQKLLKSTLEVSNDYNSFFDIKNKIKNLDAQIDILDVAIKNAEILYNEGETDYLQVVLIQQKQLAVKLDKLNIQKDLIDTYLNIFKLIGYKI